MNKRRGISIFQASLIIILAVLGGLYYLFINNPDFMGAFWEIKEAVSAQIREGSEIVFDVPKQVIESFKSTPVVYSSDNFKPAAGDTTFSYDPYVSPAGEEPIIKVLTPRGMEAIKEEDEVAPEVLPFMPEVWVSLGVDELVISAVETCVNGSDQPPVSPFSGTLYGIPFKVGDKYIYFDLTNQEGQFWGPCEDIRVSKNLEYGIPGSKFMPMGISGCWSGLLRKRET